MRCEICNRGPMHGVSLFRRNPFGEKGIWRCKNHMCAEAFDSAKDPDVAAIVDAIEGKETIQ